MLLVQTAGGMVGFPHLQVDRPSGSTSDLFQEFADERVPNSAPSRTLGHYDVFDLPFAGDALCADKSSNGFLVIGHENQARLDHTGVLLSGPARCVGGCLLDCGLVISETLLSDLTGHQRGHLVDLDLAHLGAAAQLHLGDPFD